MTDKAVFGRLAVEQRIVAVLALLSALHFGWLVVWAALAFEPQTLTMLAEPSTLGVAIAGALLVLLGISMHVVVRMPSTRWPRLDRAPGPSPLWATLFGPSALLVWPLLLIRDRRARHRALEARAQRDATEQEIELAFRELLALPRVAATSLAVGLALATLAAAVLISRVADLDAGALSTLVTLSLAALLPLVSLASSRIRAMLVPEYLAAPRPVPLALPHRRSLALRLGGPAGLALLGAVIAPVLVGALWTERVASLEARASAERDASSLLAVAETGDRQALDAMLAQHPDRGLVTPSGSIGTIPKNFSPKNFGPEGFDVSRGFVDLDQDGQVDHLIASDARDTTVACVRLAPPPAPPAWTWVALIALGFVAGLASLTLLLRDVERDLGRASRQVAAVADGQIPEPMAVETFATAELRGIVAAVDRLVGRITDANVHKYVLIEKGHEADRLKSQFLANMSHDLRSPLNSVLGFSELLATGIEGELEPKQLEMVGTIHRTGKDLLQQIDDILDTAKIEAGHMELHREPTPPVTLITRAIQRTRVRVTHPIEFDTTFAPGLPPAFVDPYRTTQALENVLLFAAEGLQNGTIDISCEAQRERDGGREIILCITSPRALVPLSELEQARRGFFRLPGHTGLGLGLPIATSILELQGGKLLIEDGSSNSLGGRAAMGFELRLPALTARRNVRARPT